MTLNRFRIFGPALVALLATVVLAGCGGENGASQDELERARAEGAKEARDQVKVSQLQRQVKQLQKQQKQQKQSGGTAGNSGSPAPAAAPSVGPAKTCAGGIGASSATSCDFAINVAGEYGSNPGASSISAYSPVTDRFYTMSCAAMSGWSAVCTGGSGAAVFIP